MLPNTFRVSAANTAPLVTLAELKAHLNLFDETAYDAYLGRLQLAGQNLAEAYLGEFIGNTTIVASWLQFADRLILPHRQVATVTSVTYFDDSNVSQTVASSNYLFDQFSGNPSVKRLDSVAAWTTDALSRDYEFPVNVTYVTEVNLELQNEAVRQAILLYCSAMFSSREGYAINEVPNRLPITAERLLAPLRRISL